MFQDHHNYIPESYLSQKIIMISGMSFFGIHYGAAILLSFFIAFDTVFGISKSVVLFGWQSITYQKFWGGIITKIGILFIPISVAVSGALLDIDLKPIVKLSMYTLIVNDAISCYTNILSIKKKQNFENKDLIETLINFLRSLLFDAIKGAMSKFKNDNTYDNN